MIIETKLNIDALHQWFFKCARSFPWRENKTPYRVWISEVMLQQTKASVVIPYFLKWIKLFPTLESVAESPLEALIKTWEGLGYYNRVRFIHKTAKMIVQNHHAIFPSDKKNLEKLFGFGPYMVDAMLSFAFEQRATPLDGNVSRVLCRFFSLNLDISKLSSKTKLRSLEEKLLDSNIPWITAEALIELGATICNKKATCNVCPIKKNCLAYIEKKVDTLPYNSHQHSLIKLKRMVFFLESKDFFLMKKETNKLMKDLYQMPYLDIKKELSISEIERVIKTQYNLEIDRIIKLKPIKQYFTKHEAFLVPYSLFVEKKKEVRDFEWINKEEANELPISSGHRKILQSLKIL